MARSRARDADADGLLGSLMGKLSQYIVVPLRPRSNGSIKHARMPTSMRSQGPSCRVGGGTADRWWDLHAQLSSHPIQCRGIPHAPHSLGTAHAYSNNRVRRRGAGNGHSRGRADT